MVNRIQDAFYAVEASEDVKISTIQFLQSERQKRTERKAGTTLYRTIAAVCVILLFVTGISGYQILKIPVSYVSIDINPSIELALNRFDRVVSATAYNEDGEIILAGLAVTGKKYTAAIDIIMESESMGEYLTKEAELIFTVAANNGEKENQLRNGIANCQGCSRHGGRSFGAAIDTVAKAHGNGLSLGKYSAYLQLVQYDETVTVDACRQMSMSEIHGLIDKHQQHGRDDDGSKNTRGCAGDSKGPHGNQRH